MTTTPHRSHLPAPTMEPDGARHPIITTAAGRAIGALRIAFGLTFLWAFVDKLFGLGYATKSGKGWIDGGDVTAGFLKGAGGPLGSFYHSLAGDWWVSPLFMIGLAGIGLALTLGIGLRVAAVAGTLLYLLMWTASMPLETNPVLDDHILGALSMVVFGVTLAGNTWGLGTAWNRMPLVRRFPILR